MPSSTSSSDVHVRDIPAGPWASVIVLCLVLVALSVGAWEYQTRQLGLTAGDLDDGAGHWAQERRKIDREDIRLAIAGSSRILFDTDLDIWQSETGVRPLQLALAGTSPRIVMEDLANDDDFSGVLLVGVTPGLYFGFHGGYYEAALAHYETESPSQWFGHKIFIALSRVFAFLDTEYRLFPLLERNKIPNREGVRSPYLDVWKIWTNSDDRQTFTWERISRDTYLREHAIGAWMDETNPFIVEVTDADADAVIEETITNIEIIRSRGGEVVFVRPPSSDGFREGERQLYPRARLWDRLIAETNSVGIHFEDYPELSDGMVTIEWSHLEKESAQRYSHALAQIVQARLAERGYELSPRTAP
jgi:hypothetical protein